jgi:formamidase
LSGVRLRLVEAGSVGGNVKSIEVDLTKRCSDEPEKGHNRWHPDIPPVLEVEPEETIVLQTRDAFDGQINQDTRAEDLPDLDLNLVHPLTGPVLVKGAHPGDLLEVEIVEVVPAAWGFTIIVPGFGFVRDLFAEPFLVKWKIEDGHAESPELPGVRIPGAPFMGTIGVAPSRALYEKVLSRESDLSLRGGFVLGPDAGGAVPTWEPVASEGLRTIPPRENGGNLDIKQLTRGSRLLLPVFVEGALFSAGDAHYAQGDCECCGTAIEVTSTFHVRFLLHEGDAIRRGISLPIFQSGDEVAGLEQVPPRRFIAATGMPILDGANESEDVTLATRQALLNMIQLLVERGFSREQAYSICSVAVDLKVSELVDVPNCVVSAFLPLDIFGE